MKSLYDFNYEQIQEFALEQGWKKFRGHQIFQWLYRSHVKEIDEMSNLSKETRELLKENFLISPLTLREKQVARDGTTKYLFALSDGSLIESVLMQFDYGKSVCVTSQVGCNMGCAFCASGLTKKQRDLTSGEMVAQVLYIQQELDAKEERVSHIVVMALSLSYIPFQRIFFSLITVTISSLLIDRIQTVDPCRETLCRFWRKVRLQLFRAHG